MSAPLLNSPREMSCLLVDSVPALGLLEAGFFSVQGPPSSATMPDNRGSPNRDAFDATQPPVWKLCRRVISGWPQGPFTISVTSLCY